MKTIILLLSFFFYNNIHAQTIIIDSVALGVKKDIRKGFEILFPAKWDTLQKLPKDLFRAIDNKNEKVVEASGQIAVRRFFVSDSVAKDSIIKLYINWYSDKFLFSQVIDSTFKTNKNNLNYLMTTISFRTKNYYEKITLSLCFFERNDQLYILLIGGSKKICKKYKKDFDIIIDNFKLL